MADYLIALDVGGTKTDAVLFTPDGTVLRHAVALGANPLDVGLGEACRRYLQAINALLGDDITHVRALYGGIACIEGFEERIYERLQEQISCDHMRLEGDGPCLISTMLGHADGACLICGTGSALIIRKGEWYTHIGGWGYLIDSCSSGFILGRKAVYAAVRAYDGRGEKTLISDLLHARCGEPIEMHLEKLYSGGRPYFASLASVVFDARRAGDRVAAQIFDECVDDLNELIWTAYRRLGGAYTLVLGGGIFRNFPEYVQALTALAPPEVSIVTADAPPVYGGAVEAMHAAGIPCGADFKANFLQSYIPVK